MSWDPQEDFDVQYEHARLASGFLEALALRPKFPAIPGKHGLVQAELKGSTMATLLCFKYLATFMPAGMNVAINATSAQQVADAERRMQYVFAFADRMVFSGVDLPQREALVKGHRSGLSSKILRLRFPGMPPAAETESIIAQLSAFWIRSIDLGLQAPWATIGHQWAKTNDEASRSQDAVKRATIYGLKAAMYRAYLTAEVLLDDRIPTSLPY
jgi:hypothetical protein